MKYYFVSYSFNSTSGYGINNVTLCIGKDEIFSVSEIQRLIVVNSKNTDSEYTKVAIINFQEITEDEFDIEFQARN